MWTEEKTEGTGKTGCAGEKRNTGRTDHVSLKRGEMGELPGCCKRNSQTENIYLIAMKCVKCLPINF